MKHPPLVTALGRLVCLVFVCVALPVRAETYVLTVHETPDQIGARTDPDRAAAYWAGFADFGRELQTAGLIRGGNALETNSLRIVTSAGSKTEKAAGNAPVLSGYFVIDVATHEEALRWAARVPAIAHGGSVSVFACVPSPSMK